MELRTLRYFVTVSEELNITNAAAKLNISQPPLSAQIKNLEYELNTVLFIRGKRHLQLTDSGQLLYRRAKEIVNLADKAKEEMLIAVDEAYWQVVSVKHKKELAEQYKALLALDNVELVYEPEALEAIADKAIEMEIGARGLRSVMEKAMTKVMYEVPSDPTIRKVIITAECIRNGTEPQMLRA